MEISNKPLELGTLNLIRR